MIPKLWTTVDVAEYLGVPVATVYQWRTRGYGPAGRRVGKHLRFKPEDVVAWFDDITAEKIA
ncbi:helix-turn-helix domain-containing protein [Kineosporia succinea]|uniref:Excisionase family DNA binding protein n=1 Tax=Kineosporia succinea TaxID=84632 RepID=A0ABT9P1H8_9ACTN|nr:helix-turn-helix domain-containing protein [Kineosporia succinea]MDP9826534.1 excisionase family DNA binding protein [Kineosporia succinea]